MVLLSSASAILWASKWRQKSGQRYHVLVHDLETPYEAERYGNNWIRVNPTRKCSKVPLWSWRADGLISPGILYPTRTCSRPYLIPCRHRLCTGPLMRMPRWRSWCQRSQYTDELLVTRRISVSFLFVSIRRKEWSNHRCACLETTVNTDTVPRHALLQR